MRRFTCGQWAVTGLLLIVLLVMCLPLVQTVHWVGHTQLEVEFVVTEAGGGQPVEGATITIRTEEGGFCRWERGKKLVLVTDADGRAKKRCTCMCFGSSGWRTNTFGIHLPDWWVAVAAPGFRSSQETPLGVIVGYPFDVRRGEGCAYLMVALELHK
jgi:hypothetical protein